MQKAKPEVDLHCLLSHALYEGLQRTNLCKPEHLQQIRETGALSPTYSMRHRCTRERVSWATSLDGRWFTNGLVKSALEHLLKTHDDVVIPDDTPGFTMEQWYTTTADKLALLLQRARRSTASAAMDTVETQPWDLEDLDPTEDAGGSHERFNSEVGYI